MRTTVPKERLEQLRAIPLLAGCNDRDLAAIDACVEERTLPAGTVLVREGAHGSEAFLLVGGSAEVTVGGKLVATVGEGSFIGEIGALEHGSRTATVTAATPVRVLIVNPGSLEDVLARGQLGAKLTRELAARLRVADTRLAGET